MPRGSFDRYCGQKATAAATGSAANHGLVPRYTAGGPVSAPQAAPGPQRDHGGPFSSTVLPSGSVT